MSEKSIAQGMGVNASVPMVYVDRRRYDIRTLENGMVVRIDLTTGETWRLAQPLPKLVRWVPIGEK